jgi:hypothetical protein
MSSTDISYYAILRADWLSVNSAFRRTVNSEGVAVSSSGVRTRLESLPADQNGIGTTGDSGSRREDLN